MAEKAAPKKKGVGPVTFARQVRAEGEKVVWTSQRETIAATIMVLILSIIIALFIFLTDQVIIFLLQLAGLGAT